MEIHSLTNSDHVPMVTQEWTAAAAAAAAAKQLMVTKVYLATDCRHSSTDGGDSKHSNGHNETDDLDERHPVREVWPGQHVHNTNAHFNSQGQMSRSNISSQYDVQNQVKPSECSGVRRLHLEVFSAIQV